ncbi:unnamed protein product [Leptidea sinapis]|uniref:Uncharacterized protein n=1 Tax=Leptidea sinapis TaxID=189913 RepID=A0A5E4PWN2_9NEOP|nr:unnamed protein product [Leptidea sinapis]
MMLSLLLLTPLLLDSWPAIILFAGAGTSLYISTDSAVSCTACLLRRRSRGRTRASHTSIPSTSLARRRLTTISIKHLLT